MALPATTALNYFVTNPLGTADWKKNFDQIVNWLSDTNADLKINTLNIKTLSVYANNAAAVAGGKTAGQLYRTGADPDAVCIVH
jgi:hypothetical protein